MKIQTIYVALLFLSLIGSFLIFISTAHYGEESTIPNRPKEVWTIYDGWWGNPFIDTQYYHWRYRIYLSNDKFLEPPNHVPIQTYPQLGLYSSHDISLLELHCKKMKEIGIDTILFRWWGSNRTDDHGEGSNGFTDQTLKLLFPIAKKYALKIAIFIPNYSDRNSTTLLEDFNYISENYISESNYERINEKPVLCIQDSYYLTDLYKTMSAFPFYFIGTPQQKSTIAVLLEDGFEAVMSFMPGEKQTWLSDPSNWPKVSADCNQRNILFIPTVGPGFDEHLVTTFSTQKDRSRENGLHYSRMWDGAINANQSIVVINSFNGWLDSTNIEPAVRRDGYPMNEKTWSIDMDPNYYTSMTRSKIAAYKSE